jgi:hypothetical protein
MFVIQIVHSLAYLENFSEKNYFKFMINLRLYFHPSLTIL